MMSPCVVCGVTSTTDASFCPQCGNKKPIKPVVDEREIIQLEIERLRQELHSVEDSIEIQSFGFYEPRFGLDSAKNYVARLKEVREQQKMMVRNKTATVCPKNWVVDGSLKKGREMMAEQTQLMLRAFNGECDAAITSVKYDNIKRIEKRLKKSLDSINKLGSTKSISISDAYYEAKLNELYLVHEHREKVYEEKETQKAIREQMREEQKAQKEIEKATKDAEKEEAKHSKALEKARAELAAATENQHTKLAALVAKLENELKDAIDRKAKSIARAQLTKSGHVYVLSNVGSFGDGVYKIGMTRRLDPLERVYELGSASVPFRFDVHAMIFCEDAPALESALHREFADRRVNQVNLRREFFRISLQEIIDAVAKHHGTITFVTFPEAKEYRKTLAINE